MAKMRKKVLKLPKSHHWRCKPGHKIFVLDRGAVRFDYPESWVMLPGETSFKFHNKKPPDDDCRLEVSFLYLRPDVDWSGLSLISLLTQALEPDGPPVPEDQVTTVVRDDLELVWAEQRAIDPGEQREAVHRLCLSRTRNTHVTTADGKIVVVRPNVQALITLDFWPEHTDWVHPVWEEVLRSLQLGI